MSENTEGVGDTEPAALPLLREQFIERVWIGLTVFASLRTPITPRCFRG